MKTNSILVLVVAIMLGIFAGNLWAGTYSGGNGEPNNPYQIDDANDMNEIGTNSGDWGSYFVMTDDINLIDYNETNFIIIGNSTTKFTGVFDGNNHVINNFSYESNGKDYVGIFGYVYASNAIIKNVILSEPNIVANGGEYIGTLVGYLRDGAITNCSVQGGEVAGKWHVGGLAGYTRDGLIEYCDSSTSVFADDLAGGLIGTHWYGSINYCYSSGNISAEGIAFEASAVGGFVGMGTGHISNCYASGDVSGTDRSVGGLVGATSGGVILNCYASGQVSDTSGNDGGLVGDHSSYNSTSFTKCFWDNSVNPLLDGFGDGTVDPNVTGKSSEEMKKESTFTNWDFVEVWNIGENQTYPYLRQYPAGDLNNDGIVNWRDFAILANNWLQ